MRVAVEKLDGVQSAEVSLNDGEVVVVLDEANQLRLDRLREVIRDQGFTPREADIRARGVVERREGRFVFRLPGDGVAFEVEGEPDVLESLEGRLAERLVVEARIDQDVADRMWITGVDPEAR